MFKFKKSYLFFLTFLNNYYIFNCYNNKLMNLWTKIDLVRASYGTHEQKEEFIKDLFSDINEFYRQIYFQKEFNKKEKVCHIKLIKIIIKNFQEVFDNINNRESLIIIFILNQILNYLKYPIDIKPKITPDHTGVKYALSSNTIIIDNRYKRI